MPGKIVIKGARVHNLKNIDLEIPREQLVVITGVSGSGKSSLAFDTLYAEGQRRYLESLGADSRRLLQQMEKPDVDSIDGLSPTIAVQQKPGQASPRSTVGTLTDIYDYLRLLFARIGQPHCVQCGREITAHTVEQVVDQLLLLPASTRILVLAPVPLASASDLTERLREFARQGFTRLMIDGEMRELDAEINFDAGAIRYLDLVIDRLAVREGLEKRLADSLELASRHGNRMLRVQVLDGHEAAPARELMFSQRFACVHCGTSLAEITPSLFSFNSPQGACPSCKGLGIVARPKARSKTTEADDGGAPCPDCGGSRLKRESRAVKIADRDIAEIAAWPISKALEFSSELTYSEDRKIVGQKIVDGIVRRLGVLRDLGLEYLSLDRSSITLSGGEFQRVRLATQVGSAMAGVLYVLDEPSIGLHQQDNEKLLALLRQLRDAGNSVLVVEHDRETMLAADYLIDMGPGAGIQGGEVVAQGTPAELARDARSLTGRYLSGALKIPIPAHRRVPGSFFTIKNANARNLKNITVAIPLGNITCVTGVSGAGKSTLVMDVLYRGVAERLKRRKEKSRARLEIEGWENFDRVIGVDQGPIGRTPRSNPATYTGIYDHLRELFAQLPEARVRGFGSERFSFNVSGGRCEACGGDGVARVEMYFLPEAFVTCAVCKGRRYNRETLDVKYKGLSIADVLDLTVDQAVHLFHSIPGMRDRLRTLHEVGLGYLRLGQSASTLAGGEAQRVKLARELARRSIGRSLYVLDEPTAGLHFEDVKKLVELLNRLADLGNTIVVVEHNLDVIKSADYVIDLGPESGDRGGEVIARGSPEEIAATIGSSTGRYLGRVLEGLGCGPPDVR
ncbi:MAG TPA: excinuclease ABC subunit UvrA [Candidatus Binatia bacterium]